MLAADKNIPGYSYPKGVQAKPVITGKSLTNGTKEYRFGMNQNVFNTKSPYETKLHKKHRKNWIAGAIKHPGALHAKLGVEPGKKLTSKELARGKKMGGKTAKMVSLAKTLKGFHHKSQSVEGIARAEQNSKGKGFKSGKFSRTLKHKRVKMDTHTGGESSKHKKLCKKHKRLHCNVCG